MLPFILLYILFLFFLLKNFSLSINFNSIQYCILFQNLSFKIYLIVPRYTFTIYPSTPNFFYNLLRGVANEMLILDKIQHKSATPYTNFYSTNQLYSLSIVLYWFKHVCTTAIVYGYK